MLRRAAGLAVVGALAGCSGDGGGEDGGTETTAAGGGTEAVESGQEVQDYVGHSSNYDGQTLVVTGQDEVTVAVGAEGNDGYYAYDPPAVQVSTGATVVWEWTGEGQTHNVVHEDGAFNSGQAVSGEDNTFSHTFEESGTYLYYCTPHETLGMNGAVVVE